MTKVKENSDVQQFEGVAQNNTTEFRENFNGMAVPDFAQRVLDQFREKGNREIFLTLPPGHAIIDPGAGQDLIGRPAYEQLRTKLAAVGLRPQPIDEEPSRASGIGGQATTLFMALIPTILGGAPGIVRVTVVQEDIPHLLSIGLLESAGSVIDTKANVIRFEEHGTQDKMLRLKSGHRTVDVTKWDGGLFPVPPQVREQYGLSEGAFNLPGATAPESYMERAAVAEGWQEVSGSPFIIKVHDTPRTSLYLPSRSEATGLTGMRVSFAQFSDGTIRHVQDDWRDGNSVLGKEWTGVSIFCRSEGCQSTFLSQHSEQQQLGSSLPCEASELDCPSSYHSSDASGHCGAMASPGGRRPGQGEEPGPRKSRRINPLPTPGEVRRQWQEPIRDMETLPEMQDQLPVHALQPAHGQDEDQEHRVCQGEGVRGHSGWGTRAPEEGESGSPAIDSCGLYGREGDAAGAHAVQPATTGGDDHGDVSSGYSPGGGSTDPAGTDAAVDGEPDNDDADNAARAILHGGDNERDVTAAASEPGRRGVGSSSESTRVSSLRREDGRGDHPKGLAQKDRVHVSRACQISELSHGRGQGVGCMGDGGLLQLLE